MSRYSHSNKEDKLTLSYIIQTVQFVAAFKDRKLEPSHRYQLRKLQKELINLVRYIQQKYYDEYTYEIYKADFLNMHAQIEGILNAQVENAKIEGTLNAQVENKSVNKNLSKKKMNWKLLAIGAMLFVCGYLVGRAAE